MDLSIFVSVCILLISGGSFSTADHTVKTRSGAIRGAEPTTDRLPLVPFLGIPYAEPPTGRLRFERPVPKARWAGIYNATKRSPYCIQAPQDPAAPNQSENCLYLNVWAPTEGLVGGKKLPVMIWIHGGGLVWGSAMEMGYDASLLSVMGKVVVVSMNYRLGPFGFLYFGQTWKSNLGFWDQRLAMKWVKQNIAAFGGDPRRITIFGESAGSWSVSAHLSSPFSRGLFQRAILQSGSSFSQLAQKCPSERLSVTEKFAADVGCRSSQDPRQWMRCLKRLPAEHLSNSFFKRPQVFPFFSSVYGDGFLPISTREALETRRFDQNVELLTGTVRDEGSFILPMFNRTLFDPMEPQPITRDQALNTLAATILPSDQAGLMVSLADRYYFQNATTSDDIRQRLVDVLGDFGLHCPTIMQGWWTARWNADRQGGERMRQSAKPVYSYYLTHKPKMSPLCGNHTWMGVCHADDLPFVFGYPFAMKDQFTNEDRQLSKDVIRIWTQWAYSGTLPRLADGQEWPAYGLSNGEERWLSEVNTYHVELNPDPTKMWTVLKDLKAHNCQQVFKSLLQFC